MTIEIKLKIKASANENKIEGWLYENGARILKIRVKAHPEQGKANKAIVKLLSKEWKIQQKDLVITGGVTSIYKILTLPRSILPLDKHLTHQ